MTKRPFSEFSSPPPLPPPATWSLVSGSVRRLVSLARSGLTVPNFLIDRVLDGVPVSPDDRDLLVWDPSILPCPTPCVPNIVAVCGRKIVAGYCATIPSEFDLPTLGRLLQMATASKPQLQSAIMSSLSQLDIKTLTPGDIQRLWCRYSLPYPWFVNRLHWTPDAFRVFAWGVPPDVITAALAAPGGLSGLLASIDDHTSPTPRRGLIAAGFGPKSLSSTVPHISLVGATAVAAFPEYRAGVHETPLSPEDRAFVEDVDTLQRVMSSRVRGGDFVALTTVKGLHSDPFELAHELCNTYGAAKRFGGKAVGATITPRGVLERAKKVTGILTRHLSCVARVGRGLEAAADDAPALRRLISLGSTPDRMALVVVPRFELINRVLVSLQLGSPEILRVVTLDDIQFSSKINMATISSLYSCIILAFAELWTTETVLKLLDSSSGGHIPEDILLVVLYDPGAPSLSMDVPRPTLADAIIQGPGAPLHSVRRFKLTEPSGGGGGGGGACPPKQLEDPSPTTGLIRAIRTGTAHTAIGAINFYDPRRAAYHISQIRECHIGHMIPVWCGDAQTATSVMWPTCSEPPSPQPLPAGSVVAWTVHGQRQFAVVVTNTDNLCNNSHDVVYIKQLSGLSAQTRIPVQACLLTRADACVIGVEPLTRSLFTQSIIFLGPTLSREMLLTVMTGTKETVHFIGGLDQFYGILQRREPPIESALRASLTELQAGK